MGETTLEDSAIADAMFVMMSLPVYSVKSKGITWQVLFENSWFFWLFLYKADKQNTPSNKKYIFLITWFTLFVLETLKRFWVKTKEVYNLILSI